LSGKIGQTLTTLHSHETNKQCGT